MTLADIGVDAFLIIRAVTGEKGERPRNLVEQGADLRAVITDVGGQFRRDDPYPSAEDRKRSSAAFLPGFA